MQIVFHHCHTRVEQSQSLALSRTQQQLTMDRELWKQVDALLEQALEQPPEAAGSVRRRSVAGQSQSCAMKC